MCPLKLITIRRLLWNKSLNSDGHKFHQYQQNEQSPLILTKLTDAQTCGLDKPVNWIPTLPSC